MKCATNDDRGHCQGDAVVIAKSKGIATSLCVDCLSETRRILRIYHAVKLHGVLVREPDFSVERIAEVTE